MPKTALPLHACLLLTCLAAPAAAAAPPAREPISERDAARLVAPEPGARPAEYRAHPATLRLFGTQGTAAAASATFADTATWATRTYRVGETIGRSLKLLAVHDHTAELYDSVSGARLAVAAGEDLRVRVIEHDFDVAAIDNGEHQWSVRSTALARLLSRYGIGGSGQPATLHGAALVRLSAVQPQGALARLGFQDGDLLVSVNGEPATPATPAALCTAMTQPANQVVQVTLIRHGVRFELAYALD